MRQGRNERHGTAAILFHWSIALLFAAQLPLGFAMARAVDDPILQFSLFQWHKSVGFLVLALAVPRAVWSLLRKHPAPAPAASVFEARLARLVHRLLLASTLAIPMTGWAIASASPLRIPSFVFDLFVVPGLPIPVSDAAEAVWSGVHAVLAYGTGALIVLHAGAALVHHFHRRDGTLARMLPGRQASPS